MSIVSEVHSERLSFLRNYIACLEQGHRFSIDQFFMRESAELERSGFDPNDSIAQYRMAEVQLFAIEVEEAFRAQMVVVIWGFLERLISEAIFSIASFEKTRKKFVKKRNESLVDCWRSFLEKDVHSGVDLSSSEWEMLSDILAVRNFIAHSSHRPGNHPRNKQKHAVGRIPGMRLAPDGIAISKECIESLMGMSENILIKFGGEHWRYSEALDL
jgi:hypothetical protein